MFSGDPQLGQLGVRGTIFMIKGIPEFMFKRAIKSADFWAARFPNKEECGEWYGLFQGAVRELKEFVMEGYGEGLKFKEGGKDQWNLLLEGQYSTFSPISPKK